jgi:hypothetical protein
VEKCIAAIAVDVHVRDEVFASFPACQDKRGKQGSMPRFLRYRTASLQYGTVIAAQVWEHS